MAQKAFRYGLALAHDRDHAGWLLEEAFGRLAQEQAPQSEPYVFATLRKLFLETHDASLKPSMPGGPEGDVEGALARLSAAERELLYFAVLAGCTMEEIGTRTGHAGATIDKALGRMHQKLAALLPQPGAPLTSLAPRLQAHYGFWRLEAEQLQRIRNAVVLSGEDQPVDSTSTAKRAVLRYGIVLVVFFMGVLGMRACQSGRAPVQEWARRAAQEMASHHDPVLEVELLSSDFSKLDSMSRLDFAPVEPSSIRGDYRLLGASYCQILGRLAAQVLLEDEDGARTTLFEMRGGASLADLGKASFVIGGVRVRMWREDDVIVGLAAAE